MGRFGGRGGVGRELGFGECGGDGGFDIFWYVVPVW